MNKIQSALNQLNSKFVERDEFIQGLFLAALTENNIFVIGKPGTGKSKIINDFASMFNDSKVFSILLNSFTNPQEIFGALDLKSLEQGIHKNDTTGMLPECQFAFLDEVFKCNSGCLNALLGVMNEKKFRNGREIQECKTKVFVGASNEIPYQEELEPFFDRFILRYHVDYISGADSFKEMLKLSQNVDELIKFSESDISEMKSLMDNIEITDRVVKCLDTLRGNLQTRRFTISDRSWVKSMQILKANAVLSGRDKIDIEDFRVFSNMAWRDLEQIKKLKIHINDFIEVNRDYFISSMKVSGESEIIELSEEDAVHEIITTFKKKVYNLHATCKEGNCLNVSEVEDCNRLAGLIFKEMNILDRKKIFDIVQEVNEAMNNTGRSNRISLPKISEEELQSSLKVM